MLKSKIVKEMTILNESFCKPTFLDLIFFKRQEYQACKMLEVFFIDRYQGNE